MIIVIRISGLVEMPKESNDTLSRIRLRKKYTAILLKETPENLKLLNKIRNFVAYGNIDSETLNLLLEKRAKSLNNKKVDSKALMEHIEKRGLENLPIKPYFRLHPPRGGIDTKTHFPKGSLGNNKEDINQLIRRML